MAGDASLIKGAWTANAPAIGQWDSVLQGVRDLSKVLNAGADRRSQIALAAIKKQGDRRVKGDEWTTRVAANYGTNIKGPLGEQLSVATDDVVFERDIYLGAEKNVAYQTNITAFNSQASANTATMSALLDGYDRSNRGEGEGAPMSNSARGWDVDYLTDRKLAAKYVFKMPNGETKEVVKGVDDEWLNENQEDILSGAIVMTSKNYGLLKTSVNNDQTEALTPTTTWVGVDDVKRDIEATRVNLTAKGAIADLGASQMTLGEAYDIADEGRQGMRPIKPGSQIGVLYTARSDRRKEFNEDKTKQAINTIINPDIKQWEMRSILSDPMLNTNESFMGEWDAGSGTYSMGHVDSLLGGADGLLAEAVELAMPEEAGSGDGIINTEAEVKAVKDLMRQYGDNSPDIDAAINGLVKEYLFIYAKNQFIVGSGGTYKKGLGIGKVLEEGEDGDQLFDFID